MDKIYLDYAAATPLDTRVFEAMRPYFGEKFGNAGSLHSYGQEAVAALDKSREKIARHLGVSFREVVFTGSATEANNLALRGVMQAIRTTRIPSELSKKKHSEHSDKFVDLDYMPRIIVSAVEHESVLKTGQALQKDGLIELKILPVNKNGIIKLENLKKLLNENTVLVSVMHANNETGAIQPIAEISKALADFRNTKHETLNPKQYQNSKSKNFGHSNLGFVSDLENAHPLLHVDAVQALQYLDCRPDISGADLITISGHKIYGPKGIGAICGKTNLLKPILSGGGQEFGLRSGTENIPNIAGLAEAMDFSEQMKAGESGRVRELRDILWTKIKSAYKKSELNGPGFKLGQGKRLPNNLNVYFPGIAAEEAVTFLDLSGIMVSSGSACAARSAEPSHVLLAMGLGEKRARQSIRFSLGRQTTRKEIDYTANIISKMVRRLK